MDKRPRGCLTALVTPFTAEGALDREALERLIEYQLKGGIHDLVMLGSTGEAMVLEADERDDVLQIARRGIGEKGLLVAGAGSNSTRETIELCRRVAGEGADFALVVGPYYNKPTQEGFRRHFETVADASPIPILLYNVPGRTGSNMQPETVLQLARHPRIAGIKESSGRLDQATAIMAGVPATWVVLSGEDDLTLPLMALGAVGVVSVAANVAPGLMRSLADACLEGAWSRARAEHYRLRPLFLAQFAETNPMPIKAGLEWLELCRATVRLPLVEAGAVSRQAMQAALVHAGLLQPPPDPDGLGGASQARETP